MVGWCALAVVRLDYATRLHVKVDSWIWITYGYFVEYDWVIHLFALLTFYGFNMDFMCFLLDYLLILQALHHVESIWIQYGFRIVVRKYGIHMDFMWIKKSSQTAMESILNWNIHSLKYGFHKKSCHQGHIYTSIWIPQYIHCIGMDASIWIPYWNPYFGANWDTHWNLWLLHFNMRRGTFLWNLLYRLSYSDNYF